MTVGSSRDESTPDGKRAYSCGDAVLSDAYVGPVRQSLDNACPRHDLLGRDRGRAGHDAIVEQPPDFGVG